MFQTMPVALSMPISSRGEEIAASAASRARDLPARGKGRGGRGDAVRGIPLHSRTWLAYTQKQMHESKAMMGFPNVWE
jgi:hypothetical protein